MEMICLHGTNQTMQTMKTKLITQALGVLLVTLPALTQPVTYEFTPIATTGGDVTFVAAGRLNNLGAVAFIENLADGTSALRISDGRQATPILQGVPVGSLGLGGLSDSGIIAFNFSDTDPATGTPRVRVMRAMNGLLTTLMETHPDKDSIFLGLPEVNNMGEVAFVARQPAGDFTLDQLYAGREAPLALVGEAGPGPGEGMTGPALNDSGSIAFWRYSEQVDAQGLYVWRQGVTGRVFDPLTQGLPTEVSLLGAAHGVLLNDRGSIAFNTFRRDCVTFPDGTPGPCTVGRSRLVRLDGGVITTIAERTAELSPGVPMGLNNRGDVAFLGVGSDRRSTLYVGDGGSTRRVIGQGDMLWEKTVAAILNVSFNARGQLAFVARFSDGSRVVVRATPSSAN
jgi:hypothetical protein